MRGTLLHRRVVLHGGMAVAGFLALTGSQFTPAVVASPAGSAPLTGALVGWLVMAPDGGGRIGLFDVDAESGPARQVAMEAIVPMSSVAGAARQATAVAVRAAAASWGVPAEDCTCGWGRIEHRSSGRSIPFKIWTDFT